MYIDISHPKNKLKYIKGLKIFNSETAKGRHRQTQRSGYRQRISETDSNTTGNKSRANRRAYMKQKATAENANNQQTEESLQEISIFNT